MKKQTSEIFLPEYIWIFKKAERDKLAAIITVNRVCDTWICEAW